MTIFTRVTASWWLVAFLVLFVVLKLDGTIDWSWGVVFTPMWILDLVSTLYLVIFFIFHVRGVHEPSIMSNHLCKERQVFMMFVFLWKFLFQLLLCLKLDGIMTQKYYYVFIPLWILLILLAADACRITWKERRLHGD